jgi:hypothetical protein
MTAGRTEVVCRSRRALKTGAQIERPEIGAEGAEAVSPIVSLLQIGGKIECF